MTAEEYVNRWAVELNGDFDKLAPLFRAAMAEARAQALREAIEVVDSLYVPFGETPDGWRDCMSDVLAALRKLAETRGEK